ncbi:MAG: hypothetical protein ACIAQ0_02905 [Phycisphaerales bacterium JB058]
MSGWHSNYELVTEAMHDEPTWACIRFIHGRMRDGEIIGADDEVLRDAVELHPGADRDLLRAYFTFRPKREGAA